MKKAIAILMALMALFLMPVVFADIEVGQRVTTYEDADQPIANHNGYFDVASDNDNEVAVCTTKDKAAGYVVASLKSKDLIGQAIETAKLLFAAMQGANGFEHFGCARVRV